jgi:hypothetical protein
MSGIGRRSALPPQIDCARCGVAYAPSLVDGSCPVCAARAPGRREPRFAVKDPAVLLVGTATLANLVLLAILTVLLLR